MGTQKISRVGIIGAGTMGCRVSFSCVISGKETRLFDISKEAREKAPQAIRGLIQEWETGGRLPGGTVEKAMALLSVSPSLEACVSDVDLALEAVSEKVELKRRVFADIDRYVAPHTIIGSNTSSIPGSMLADATKRPDKVFNMNLSTPNDRKCEIMGNPLTAPSTIDAVLTFVREIGLVPIRVKREIMGYIENRVWRAVKKEVFHLIAGGYATPDDIDRGWILDWHTPLGPCGLIDQCGVDVIYDIEMMYYKTTGDPSDKPPDFLREMVEQGKLGIKSGEGFYKYPNPRYKQPGWLEGLLDVAQTKE